MKKVSLTALLVLCLATLAYAQCETLTFITESLPTFEVGRPINFQIEVSGGTPPYHFEATGLPRGVTLTNAGRLHGVVHEQIDTTIFVTVTDAAGCQLTQAFAFRAEEF